MTRTQVINRIIRTKGYKTYLEIGVSTRNPAVRMPNKSKKGGLAEFCHI